MLRHRRAARENTVSPAGELYYTLKAPSPAGFLLVYNGTNSMDARRRHFIFRVLPAATLALAASGCAMNAEEFQRGYVLDEGALARVKPGMSMENVLEIMGSATVVSTVGNKSWYYISQTTKRGLHFMGETVTDQRVVAIYFNQKSRVERVAHYGMQDGVMFDFIARRTVAGGADQNFLNQVFEGLLRF
ncbi:MAG: outer membrane protein assembly factor BamE [Methylobacteriaceae bacterium]|jgi:outer membrane protein assembly factor BamE (lipoprotein component of BamABCDE complex)|nr:outer membrane protein assembly factor BamE [Methylobacteriaceae bacterium]